MRILIAVTTCAILLLSAQLATADDGDPRFRRTTPRAALTTSDGALVIGIPGGRAWGIESELRTLPSAATVLFVRLAVTDARVREAFVRVAYYGSPAGRTRQLAIADSAPVEARGLVLVAVELDPPPGAVAYRVRVLARLDTPDGRSADDAVIAILHAAGGGSRPAGSRLSRLLP